MSIAYVKSKAKTTVSNQDDLEKVVDETLAHASAVVGRTFGPSGRPALIERDGMSPLITKDGVTVLKHLGLPSATHNLVLDTVKEVSLNTARDAGDGTTTAIILADALVRAGKDFLRNNPKSNPQRVMRELNACYKTVIIPFLQKVATPVSTDEELVKVALISANGDEEIADVVVKAVTAAGEDGTVLIQEDQGGGMRVETVDGYITTTGLRDIGAIGAAFVNDRSSQQVRMDAGLVVLFDGTLNDLVLPAAIQSACENNPDLYGKPIVVFAHDFADPVIEKFLKSTKAGVTVLPVKTPKSTLTNSRTMFLQDMSAYTGGTVMDPATAPTFNEDNFGFFEQVRCGYYETFLRCEIDSERLEKRVDELKSILAGSRSEHDSAHLRAHIGKLTGGIATVWVGGMTDAEIREKRDRVQDAVEAVRSAVAEGSVPGGCATHLCLVYEIMKSSKFKPSWEILTKALQQPFVRLLTNCGEEDMLETVSLAISRSANNSENGLSDKTFDADNHELVHAFAAGIIEPAKVHRIAIGNALSVASVLMTVGGIVVAPRDYNLETQLELSKDAFKNMLNQGEEQ
jgi:chaperonin GroEL